jgi:hypothetical protein
LTLSAPLAALDKDDVPAVPALHEADCRQNGSDGRATADNLHPGAAARTRCFVDLLLPHSLMIAENRLSVLATTESASPAGGTSGALARQSRAGGR